MDGGLTVWLSHPVRTEADLDRVGRIARGAAVIWTGRRFRRAEACGDDAPSPGRRARLIAGDPVMEVWPSGPFGSPMPSAGALAPVDEVWVVGPEDEAVRADVSSASAAGVPVRRPGEMAVGAMLAAGEASSTRPVAVLALVGRGRREFAGALSVVRAWHLSQSWRLGGGSARMDGQGGRPAESFASRAESVALRTVAAVAVVHAARLTTDELAALRLREIEGRTWRGVALALGWPDDGRSDDRAARMCRRALGRIDAALRAREAA